MDSKEDELKKKFEELNKSYKLFPRKLNIND